MWYGEATTVFVCQQSFNRRVQSFHQSSGLARLSQIIEVVKGARRYIFSLR